MPKKPKSVQGRDAHATQQKILAAAEAEFAEKGFDGGRVDEIAKRAGVNKAMLYYYFQSKEQLLKALTEKHFKELSEEKERFIHLLSPDKPAVANQIREHCMELFTKRKSFLRILAIEALKSDEFTREFFRIIDAVIPHLNAMAERAGMDSDKLTQLKMNIFFFGFTPLLMFLTIGDTWTEYSGIDEQIFQQTFMETLCRQNVNTMQKHIPMEEPEK